MKDWVTDPQMSSALCHPRGPDLGGVLILLDVALLGNLEFLGCREAGLSRPLATWKHTAFCFSSEQMKHGPWRQGIWGAEPTLSLTPSVLAWSRAPAS